jgi:hypothetical protein
MRPSTRLLIEEVAARYGVKPADIIAHRYGKRLLAARVEVAKALEARGYTGPQIGAALQRDSTTAYYYLGRTTKQPQWIRPPTPPKPKVVKPKPQQPRFPIRYAGWAKGG